jgi:hypothetical protein
VATSRSMWASASQVGWSWPGAHISGQFVCTGGQFSNPNGLALSLERATVSGALGMESAVLEGVLNLTAARTSSYHDNRVSWPKTLQLDGFVYDTIEGASAKERLDWLRRNEKGYLPQIHEHLAAVYRRSGREEDACRILIGVPVATGQKPTLKLCT